MWYLNEKTTKHVRFSLFPNFKLCGIMAKKVSEKKLF